MRLLSLFILLLSFSSLSFARTSKVLDFYQGHFELIKLEPLCPPSLPDGISCMAIGSRAVVKAYAGCLGKEGFFDTQIVSTRGLTQIYITSLIKTDLDMESRVRCIKPVEIIKDIILPSHVSGEVEIINKKIQ
jgi:hypothetical protein